MWRREIGENDKKINIDIKTKHEILDLKIVKMYDLITYVGFENQASIRWSSTYLR